MIRSQFLLVVMVSSCLSLGACDDPSEPENPESVSPVAWLTENAVSIASIEPAHMDFVDLAPLKEVLADRRIVLLGEQSHGDGATFLAKTRLIEFLHQEMGFDVLAFESGFYDCDKSWRQLQEGMDPRLAFRRSVFQVWKLSDQVQPLIDYWAEMATGAHPLELAGFDCQFTGRSSYDFFVADLRARLSAIGSDIESDPSWPAYRGILLKLARNNYNYDAPPSPSEQEEFFAMHDRVEAELAEVQADPDPEETAFWRQQIRSTRAQAQRMWSIDFANFESNPDSLLNLRDQQMADNLIWLAEGPYRGRNIIVWAATYHIVRELSSIEVPAIPGLYDGLVPMGEILAENLGDEMYTVGFTASSGMAGTIFEAPWSLPPLVEGSLEDLLSQTSFDQAFVDFRGLREDGAWLHDQMTSRPLGYMEMVADWTGIMDGLIYTRVMTPSTRVAARDEH